MGQPKVMLVPDVGGSRVPYVLHQDYMIRGQFLTWEEQEDIYRTHPEKWEKFSTVCDELHLDSIKWLNNAYAEISKSLEPFLGDDDYHRLQGWDTIKHGRQLWNRPGAIGSQALPSQNFSQFGTGTKAAGGIVPGSGQSLP